MSQLFGLLYRARNFFVFVLLQIICVLLIRKNNVHWDVSFFNTSNAVAAQALAYTHETKEYLYLTEINNNLTAENKMLREKLVALQQMQGRPDNYYSVDSVYASRFVFKTAKVINSTIGLEDNYITINKGRLDGIEPGMGVISPRGVVGQVMSCNDHYSRVYSILHSEFTISSEVLNQALRKKGENALGLCKWDGRSHRYVEMQTVDKFKTINVGDSVVTSEQNLIFPSKLLIGKVSKVTDDKKDAFHKIAVRLSADFTGLTYVYVVENKLLKEEEEPQIISENEYPE